MTILAAGVARAGGKRISFHFYKNSYGSCGEPALRLMRWRSSPGGDVGSSQSPGEPGAVFAHAPPFSGQRADIEMC
jgi:hypothetical protein